MSRWRGYLLGAVLLLLVPWPSTVVPAWELTVLDQHGYRVPGIVARQEWQYRGVMPERLEQSLFTNAEGRVRFSRRRVWANLIQRGAVTLRVVRQDPYHFDLGRYAKVHVWDIGYTTGVAEYRPGRGLPSRVVLKYDNSPLAPVRGSARLDRQPPKR